MVIRKLVCGATCFAVFSLGYFADVRMYVADLSQGNKRNRFQTFHKDVEHLEDCSYLFSEAQVMGQIVNQY